MSVRRLCWRAATRCWVLAAVALLAVTGCDPVDLAEDPPPPTTTTTTTTTDRIPLPTRLERGSDDPELIRIDRILLTDAEVARLGLQPPRRGTVDSALYARRCGGMRPDEDAAEFLLKARTRDSNGSVDRPVVWRNDVAAVDPTTAAELLTAMETEECDQMVNVYGSELTDYGTVPLDGLDVDASLAFCWGHATEEKDHVPAGCVALLLRDDLLVRVSVNSYLVEARELIQEMAAVASQRLAR